MQIKLNPNNFPVEPEIQELDSWASDYEGPQVIIRSKGLNFPQHHKLSTLIPLLRLQFLNLHQV